MGVNPTSHYFRLGAVEGCHHFHHWNRCHSFLPFSLSLTSSFCCDPSLTLGFAVMGYSATLLTFPPKNYMTSTQTSTTMQTCMPLERFFSSHLFLLLSFLDFFCQRMKTERTHPPGHLLVVVTLHHHPIPWQQGVASCHNMACHSQETGEADHPIESQEAVSTSLGRLFSFCWAWCPRTWAKKACFHCKQSGQVTMGKAFQSIKNHQKPKNSLSVPCLKHLSITTKHLVFLWLKIWPI